MHNFVNKISINIDNYLSENNCEYRICTRCFYSAVFYSQCNFPICYIPDCDELFQENIKRKEIADTHIWSEIDPVIADGFSFSLACTKCGILAYIERNIPVCELSCDEQIIKNIIL